VLKLDTNPLFDQATGEVQLDKLSASAVHRRRLNTARRQLRNLRSGEHAAQAIAGLDLETEIFGFTKGQFSLLDLIGVILPITGPAHLSISTWTAASFEIQSLSAMAQRGDITGTRWLIDFSMARREPAITAQLRENFGQENIRVALNHAKFCLFQNATWRAVLRSSMNLNMNPRYEDFQLAHDPELAAFLNALLDEVFAQQTKGQADARPYEIVKHWDSDL